MALHNTKYEIGEIVYVGWCNRHIFSYVARRIITLMETTLEQYEDTRVVVLCQALKRGIPDRNYWKYTMIMYLV